MRKLRYEEEEVSSRRDQGIGHGTEHPNLWTQRQAPGQGGVDSRLAALVRERDRNGAVRGVCSGRASRRDGRVSTEQSEFQETPTGEGRRYLHDSDGSKAESCLERGNQEEDGLSKRSKQIDTELKDKLPREQPMAPGQKRRWESGARQFLATIGDTPGV